MTLWSELDYEAKQAKARRAAEVLEGAGWLFDEAIATWTAAIIASPASAPDKREEAYRYIRATQYLREHLAGIGNDMALIDKQREIHAKRSGTTEE